MLSILPTPYWAQIYWPDWTLLTVIYWCLAMPSKVNIKFGWLIGILVDILHTSVIGHHALLYTVSAYLASSFHQRIRLYPPHQQIIPIFLILLLCHVIEIWISALIYSFTTVHWESLVAILAGALAWPWVFAVLRHLRQRIYLSEQG